MEQPTHRRIVVSERGGPDVLQILEEPRPRPGSAEVRVRTVAIGVSGHDEMVRANSFPGFPKPPFTPGVDVVGVVEALGDGVASVAEGQMVAALLSTGGGAYAEAVCLPADRVVPVPDGVDPAEAVCMVANYLTAFGMLHRAAAVADGERVLIHGAAGGVGSALVQLGALAGLEMYGTASSRNHAFLEARGVVPIDYRTEDFVPRVRELTGDGVDVVFDPIGGSRQLRRSYRVLRKGGRLVWFGVAGIMDSGPRVIVGSLVMRLLLSLLPDGKRVPMPPDSSKPIEWYRNTLGHLLGLLATGELEPQIAERIPFDEVVRAHEALARGGYTGKMVLVTDGVEG